MKDTVFTWDVKGAWSVPVQGMSHFGPCIFPHSEVGKAPGVYLWGV